MQVIFKAISVIQWAVHIMRDMNGYNSVRCNQTHECTDTVDTIVHLCIVWMTLNLNNYYNYNHFMALWILSGTTGLSQ